MPRDHIATPPELAREITIRAIQRYHETKRLYELHMSYDDDIAWTTVNDFNEATSALVVVLLAPRVEGDPFFTYPGDKPTVHIKARGFVHEGVIYLATIDEASAADHRLNDRNGGTTWVMGLVTVELANVRGLEELLALREAT